MGVEKTALYYCRQGPSTYEAILSDHPEQSVLSIIQAAEIPVEITKLGTTIADRCGPILLKTPSKELKDAKQLKWICIIKDIHPVA